MVSQGRARRSRRGEVGQDTVSCGTARRSRFVGLSWITVD